MAKANHGTNRRHCQNASGRIQKDSWKSKIVRQIYKLALKGLGAHKIINELNDANIPAITKKGKWAVSYIQNFYVGKQSSEVTNREKPK